MDKSTLSTVAALALTLAACSEPSGPPVITDEVFVMGDSIAIGYQPFIPNSVIIPDNAGTAQYTADNVNKWLGGKVYKTIIFNNGLHDVVYFTGNFASHEADYRAALDFTADVVSHHTTHPLFMLSTHTLMADPQFNTDTQRANEIAREVMAAHGIPVFDLWTVSVQQISLHATIYDGPGNAVHFSPAGSEALAAAIIKVLP